MECSGVDKTPQGLGTVVVGYALGVYMVVEEWMLV